MRIDLSNTSARELSSELSSQQVTAKGAAYCCSGGLGRPGDVYIGSGFRQVPGYVGSQLARGAAKHRGQPEAGREQWDVRTQPVQDCRVHGGRLRLNARHRWALERPVTWHGSCE
jgi:hypothetical protein